MELKGIFDLLKNSIQPQLEAMSGEVKGVADQLKEILLRQERHKEAFKNEKNNNAAAFIRVDDRFTGLPCEKNSGELITLGNRVKGLEERQRAGHGQDKECKANTKNLLIVSRDIKSLKENNTIEIGGDKYTLQEAVKMNIRQNRDQEERYRGVIKWALVSIGSVILAAISAVVKSHWKF